MIKKWFFQKNNLYLWCIVIFLLGMLIPFRETEAQIFINLISGSGIPAYIITRLSHAWYLYVFRMLVWGFGGCILFLCINSLFNKIKRDSNCKGTI